MSETVENLHARGLTPRVKNCGESSKASGEDCRTGRANWKILRFELLLKIILAEFPNFSYLCTWIAR